MLRWIDRETNLLGYTFAPDQAMRDMARDALDVQNACNACGVAQQYARVMRELRASPLNIIGTEFANQHPIAKCYIDKLASLGRMELQEAGIDWFLKTCEIRDGLSVEVAIRTTDAFYWDKEVLRQAKECVA